MGRTKTIDDDELLRIARELFRAHGHTATTRDIAAAAGLSQAALFKRFGSKEDLFLRAMAPETPDLDALFGPYPPADARADLRAIAERMETLFDAMLPTLLSVIANPDVDAARLRRWHAKLPFPAIVHGLDARLRKMRSDGLIQVEDTAAAAHALVGAIHGAVFFETVVGDHGSHAHPKHATHHGRSRGAVDMMWNGLAPRATHTNRRPTK